MSDRDRHYLSGFQKRKLKEKRDQENKKYPKLTKFFATSVDLTKVGNNNLEIGSNLVSVPALPVGDSSTSSDAAETGTIISNVEPDAYKLEQCEHCEPST